MAQELINFVYSTISGGVAYDSIKKILGSSYEVLKSYAIKGDKEEFEEKLALLMIQNTELKTHLENLKNGEVINIVNQQHSGNGDNIAGDKIIKS